MRKGLFVIFALMLSVAGCKSNKEKVVSTPEPTEFVYKSSSEESQEIVYSEDEKAELFVGSDWAIYSRYGKQVTVYNNTNEGYIKQSENCIDFIFGSEGDCEYFLTMTTKDIDRLEKEYKLKYDTCKVDTVGDYTVLKGSDMTEVVYDLGGSVYMLLEVYNYYDAFLTDFETMFEVSKSQE